MKTRILVIVTMVVFVVATFALISFSQQPAGVVVKTPYETFDISIDFGPKAHNNNAGIIFEEVQALNASTQEDVTSSIIVLSPATPVPAVLPGTEKVVIRVKNGVAGEIYNIAVRASKTDTGEKLEGTVQLNIENVTR